MFDMIGQKQTKMDSCVICIETRKDGKSCQSLKSMVSSETCDCDYSVHPSCLNEWMMKKDFKCLICRGHLKYKVWRFDVWIRNARDNTLYIVYKFFGWMFVCFIANAGLLILFYFLTIVINDFR